MDKKVLDKVFLAYDIRGLIGSELTDEFYNVLGKSLVKFLNAKKIAVGIDIRESSINFSKSLVEGIISQGCNVLDIGEVITEIGYFVAGSMSDIGGVVIVTSSHNPKEYNGAKIVGKNASVVAGNSGFDEIKKIMLDGSFSDSAVKGTVEKELMRDKYKEKVLSFIDTSKIKNLNVIVDPGNGLGGVFFDYLFSEFPISLTKLHFYPDGSFPFHAPNPAEEQNIIDIKSKAKELKTDIGIAFDGDGDRAVFIDDKGRSPSGYYTGSIIACHMIKMIQNKNSKIIHDTRLIFAPSQEIKKVGGIPIISKSGRTFIRELMQKEDALFGFEATSHMYYKNYWYWDSGMITAALMMEVVSESGRSLSELCDEYFEKYPMSGEINFKIPNTDEVFNDLTKKFEGGKIDFTDGLSIEFNNWRFNLRKSNTQPLVRLNVEGHSNELVSEKVEIFKKLLGKEFSKS